MKWQPIETAPKDGTTILVYGGVYRRAGVGPLLCYWYIDTAFSDDRGDWRILQTQCWANEPTHWMPLPDPPTTPKDDAKGGV